MMTSFKKIVNYAGKKSLLMIKKHLYAQILLIRVYRLKL